MKKTLILLAIITGITTFAESVTTKNLLKNATFENINSKGVPTFWEFSYSKKSQGTSAKIQVSKEQVKSGKNSIELSCEGDNESYFAIRQKVREFSPNDKLELKVDVYIEKFDRGSINLFYFIVSYGKKRAYPILLTIKPDNCEMNKWVTCKSTIDLAKYKDLKGLSFWVLIPKGFEGKFFIDNVSITKQK